MKLPPTKTEIRQQLEKEMGAYLKKGGAVENVPRGLSGRDTGEGILRPNQFVPGEKNTAAKEDQVPLNDVIKSIEERRNTKPASSVKPAEKPKKPKKVMMYDDFGEPLRWTWVDQ